MVDEVKIGNEVTMSAKTAKTRSSDASEVVAILRRGGEAGSEKIYVEIDEIKMRSKKNFSSIRSEREGVEGAVKEVMFVQFIVVICYARKDNFVEYVFCECPDCIFAVFGCNQNQ